MKLDVHVVRLENGYAVSARYHGNHYLTGEGETVIAAFHSLGVQVKRLVTDGVADIPEVTGSYLTRRTRGER